MISIQPSPPQSVSPSSALVRIIVLTGGQRCAFARLIVRPPGLEPLEPPRHLTRQTKVTWSSYVRQNYVGSSACQRYRTWGIAYTCEAGLRYAHRLLTDFNDRQA